jgi:hypothetical protein
MKKELIQRENGGLLDIDASASAAVRNAIDDLRQRVD